MRFSKGRQAAEELADSLGCPVGGFGPRRGRSLARVGPWRQPSPVLRAIETLAIGDRVWVWDEGSDRPACRTVVRNFHHVDRPTVREHLRDALGHSSTVEATLEHPFWVEGRGWVPASDLRPGELLRRPRAAPEVRVERVASTGRRMDVHNIEVEQAHNYFVGDVGVLVHNVSDLDSALAETIDAIDQHGLEAFTAMGSAGTRSPGRAAGAAGDMQPQRLDATLATSADPVDRHQRRLEALDTKIVAGATDGAGRRFDVVRGEASVSRWIDERVARPSMRMIGTGLVRTAAMLGPGDLGAGSRRGPRTGHEVATEHRPLASAPAAGGRGESGVVPLGEAGDTRLLLASNDKRAARDGTGDPFRDGAGSPVTVFSPAPLLARRGGPFLSTVPGSHVAPRRQTYRGVHQVDMKDGSLGDSPIFRVGNALGFLGFSEFHSVADVIDLLAPEFEPTSLGPHAKFYVGTYHGNESGQSEMTSGRWDPNVVGTPSQSLRNQLHTTDGRRRFADWAVFDMSSGLSDRLRFFELEAQARTNPFIYTLRDSCFSALTRVPGMADPLIR
jgi:hypothetical protein